MSQPEAGGVEPVNSARDRPPVAAEVDGEVLPERNDARIAVQFHGSRTARRHRRRKRIARLLEIAEIAVAAMIADSEVRPREAACRPVRAQDAVGDDHVAVKRARPF